MDNRILFVNKRPGLIEEFVSAMSEFDFTVDSTTHAVEALKFLEKAEYKVVVTGLIMEGMDGVQLISKINQELALLKQWSTSTNDELRADSDEILRIRVKELKFMLSNNYTVNSNEVFKGYKAIETYLKNINSYCA